MNVKCVFLLIFIVLLGLRNENLAAKNSENECPVTVSIINQTVDEYFRYTLRLNVKNNTSKTVSNIEIVFELNNYDILKKFVHTENVKINCLGHESVIVEVGPLFNLDAEDTGYNSLTGYVNRVRFSDGTFWSFNRPKWY